MGMLYTHFLSGGEYARIIVLLAFQGIYHVIYFKNNAKNAKKR